MERAMDGLAAEQRTASRQLNFLAKRAFRHIGLIFLANDFLSAYGDLKDAVTGVPLK